MLHDALSVVYTPRMNERLRAQSQMIAPILRPMLQVINIITLLVTLATLIEPIKQCLSVWLGPNADQGTGLIAIVGGFLIAVRCN
ncbi:MAG: hypothetical protein RL169_2134, partial [Armatimonadota bacterium]